MADLSKLIFEQTTASSSINRLSDMARTIAESPSAQVLRRLHESGGIAKLHEESFRQQATIRAALGPMEDIRRAGLQLQNSDLFKTFEMARELAEVYRARFILPADNIVSSIREHFRTDAVSAALARYATQAEDLRNALTKMRTPWLDQQDSLRSLVSFTEIQGIGHLINRFPAYHLQTGDALRVDLGDWRDEISFDEDALSDASLRPGLYADLGFDTDLTDMPTEAFEESTEIAGLRQAPPALVDIFGDPIPPSSDRAVEGAFSWTNEAHNWLMRLEFYLRRFIHQMMTERFGEDWPRHRLPNGLYDQWYGKHEADLRSGRPGRPLIEYADFTDFVLIIGRKDNWNEIFKPVFGRMEDVRESFQRLYPIRNDTMHSRPIGLDDQMLLYVEVKRIVRAFYT